MAQGERVPGRPVGFAVGTGYLLSLLGAHSRRVWARMLAERDLTPHHFGVLMALDAMGVAHQQRLSAAIGVDPRNAVPIVDLLARRGLIERTTDPADRRRRAIALTAAGRALAADLRTAGDVLERTLLAPLAPPERTELHRLLRAVFDATADPPGAGPSPTDGDAAG